MVVLWVTKDYTEIMWNQFRDNKKYPKIKGSRETYFYVINEQASHITGRGYYCES